MSYVDGFVIACPKKNLSAYKRMAQLGKRIWMKHGALQYVEAVGDDMSLMGVTLTFPKLIKAKPDEVVIFSFIIYNNKAHRDRVNKKVMADPAMNNPKFKDQSMPFEMNRFSCGGFKVIVQA